jgi:hypothetical protein
MAKSRLPLICLALVFGQGREAGKAMSKLFKLKGWLSVADAAKHLAIVFGEEVTEADVLRFALDGNLTLSVNFVNGGHARPGVLVPIGEATYKEVDFPLSKEPLRLYGGPRIRTNGVESHVLHLEKHVANLEGVYDLPMIGGERIEVENRYQQLTGGPDATNVPMDGAFVKGNGGQLCQLQDDYDDNEYCTGSTASLERIKRNISAKKIGTMEAEKLLNRHKEDRKQFLEERKSKPQTECFYAGGSLPADIVFVVRTEALTDFVQSVNAEPTNVEKPLGPTERNTLLTIIAVLCKESKLDYTKHAKTAGLIQSTAAKMGVSIGETTIEGHLKKIPDALGTRMK